MISIKQILQDDKFKNKHILRQILQDFFDLSKEDIFIKWDKRITINELKNIENMYYQYENNKIPIEYILWYCYFMDEKFELNKDTLIPRPETEYLISYVLKNIKNIDTDFTVFDIWTWSGIIWLTIAKNIEKLVVCSDVSEWALSIAKKNKKQILKYKNNVKFEKSNLLDHLYNYSWKFIICANLPYVEENFKLDEYTQKDPYTALFAGQDGLDLYRDLLDQVIKINNDDITLYFELTAKQAKTLISEYNFHSQILDTFHHNIKVLRLKKLSKLL